MTRTDLRFYQTILNKRMIKGHTGSETTAHTDVYRDIETIVRELTSDGYVVEWEIDGALLTVTIHEREVTE